jgi:hypothetical protein
MVLRALGVRVMTHLCNHNASILSVCDARDVTDEATEEGSDGGRHPERGHQQTGMPVGEALQVKCEV